MLYPKLNKLWGLLFLPHAVTSRLCVPWGSNSAAGWAAGASIPTGRSRRGEMAVRYADLGSPSPLGLPNQELEGAGPACLKLFLLFLPLTSLSCSRSGSDSGEMWERGRCEFSTAGTGPGALLTLLAVSAIYLLIKDVPKRSTLGRELLAQGQEMGER